VCAIVTDCGHASHPLTCDSYRKSIRPDTSLFTTGNGNGGGAYVDCVWVLRSRDTGRLHLQIVSANVASGTVRHLTSSSDVISADRVLSQLSALRRLVAATANWVARRETTQFAVAATNHGALGSEEMRSVETKSDDEVR